MPKEKTATKRPYRVPKPTREQCRWVIKKLKERNPNFLTDLPPAAIMQATLMVWIGSHAEAA